jgi:hypothetical protein
MNYLTRHPRDLTNAVFGRLTVLYKATPTDKNIRWQCRCVCGNEVSVHRGSLTRGLTKSCGCLNREVASARETTHGFTRCKTYRTEYGIWAAMKRRCTNPNTAAWHDYGGRGITVCRRWDKFENFLADMGRRPSGLTLDRRDNNQNYTPNNCHWATRQEQARNTRTTHLVTIDGERMSVVAACERTGVPVTTVYSRIHRSWPQHLWFT